jgi:hypothetical protein
VYSGPKNPSIKEQPYVFLLFEQTDRITLTDEWRQKLSQPMVSTAYNFTDVFRDLQLKGNIFVCKIEIDYTCFISNLRLVRLIRRVPLVWY